MWRCRRDCDPDPEPRSPGQFCSSSPFDRHGHELGVPAGTVLPPHPLGHREALRPRFTIPAVWLGAWLLQYCFPNVLRTDDEFVSGQQHRPATPGKRGTQGRSPFEILSGIHRVRGGLCLRVGWGCGATLQ